MKKFKSFKILWHYLKGKKFKLFLYILLVVLTYIPSLLSAFFLGFAIENLINLNFYKFGLFLLSYEGLHILFYVFFDYPREKLYMDLELTFMKNVSLDMYEKIQNLPCSSFEEIGVGEFINRLYSDPERVMELLAKLMKMICRSVVVIIFLQ